MGLLKLALVARVINLVDAALTVVHGGNLGLRRVSLGVGSDSLLTVASLPLSIVKGIVLSATNIATIRLAVAEILPTAAMASLDKSLLRTEIVRQCFGPLTDFSIISCPWCSTTIGENATRILNLHGREYAVLTDASLLKPNSMRGQLDDFLLITLVNIFFLLSHFLLSTVHLRVI